MNSTLRRRIRETGDRVRQEVWLTEDFDEDLACACAVASYYGHLLLNREGISASFVLGRFDDEDDERGNTAGYSLIDANHCWIEHGAFIIDLTLTQFEADADPVSILPKTDLRYLALTRGVRALHNVRTEWSGYQNPYYHKRLKAKLL